MARTNHTATDIVAFFLAHAVDGVLFGGKDGKTRICSAEEMGDPDSGASDAVLKEMRRLDGGDTGPEAGAVARHFLLTRDGDSPWHVRRSSTSDNKVTSKRAHRSALHAQALLGHPNLETTVLTVVESSGGGITIVGAECAEDVLALMGVVAVGPAPEAS